jgi:hypothetical protein
MSFVIRLSLVPGYFSSDLVLKTWVQAEQEIYNGDATATGRLQPWGRNVAI